jgi:hypothetical protein
MTRRSMLTAGPPALICGVCDEEGKDMVESRELRVGKWKGTSDVVEDFKRFGDLLIRLATYQKGHPIVLAQHARPPPTPPHAASIVLWNVPKAAACQKLPSVTYPHSLRQLRPLTEDSQYFSREEMISLLATWMRNPPYFWIRANASDSPRHSVLSRDFRPPLRPSRNQSAHVRKHRLVIGTVRQDYTRGATRCRTRPGLSGTVSERRYTIYGNRRFVCDVARPLFRPFLYKNFLFVYGIFSSPMLP